MMPRSSRIDAVGALHHIMVRGIERSERIFDWKDKQNQTATSRQSKNIFLKARDIPKRCQQGSLCGAIGRNSPGDRDPVLCMGSDTQPFSSACANRSGTDLYRHEASFNRPWVVVQSKTPPAGTPLSEPL